MTDPLAALEQRVAVLEQEVAALKQARLQTENNGVRQSTLPAAYVPMLRRAWDNRITPEQMREVLKQMGITGEPIGAENLQRMMIEAGINPNSNEFSQGIIEMREE
jgi:hypothetical protein